MSSGSLTKISVRSLLYRWRQYFSLFLVCAFGVGISFFCKFLVDGMLDALTQKARLYYGGDFQFLGGTSGSYANFDMNEKLEKLRALLPKDAVVSARIDCDARNGCEFFFEGIGVRQRVVKGVDFSREKDLFKTMNFIDGSIENVIAKENSILISEPIAKMLDCKVGDSLTWMIETYDTIMNTVDVVVGGIFLDSSVFGMYTSYTNFDFLKKTVEYPENFYNRMTVFFPDGNFNEKDLVKYQKILSENFNMYKLTNDKEEFYDVLENGPSEPIYALISLDANMQELNIIIDAMKIVTLLIIVALVVIIVVGISSTYRVIVMKRINEIGIYKAIGMSRLSVYMLLVFETISLLLAGCFAGLVIYGLLSALVSVFDFSFIPAFDVFLVAGRAIPLFSFKNAVLIFVVVLVTTLLAVLFSVREAVRKMPCEALAVTE